TRSGGVHAVADVSLEIAEGEFFSLLGPSGCGKTTTLRMVAGFELPDTGRIVMQGKDVTEVRANCRPVNMVFQQYALFPHMSIYDNVTFGLKVKRVPRSEHRGRVTELLRIVGLEGLEQRRPKQLSGGQQQRVALARALVNRPTALLLDVPLDELVGGFALSRFGEGERVVAAVDGAHRVGDAVRVAVRPEHVKIGAAGDEGSRLEGTIAELVFLGMYTQFHVDTPAGRIVSHRLAAEAARVETGARVTLSWQP